MRLERSFQLETLRLRWICASVLDILKFGNLSNANEPVLGQNRYDINENQLNTVFAVVQVAKANTDSLTNTLTCTAFASPVPAGQTIIVTANISSGNTNTASAVTISDNNSNTYTTDVFQHPAGGAASASSCAIGHCVNATLKSGLQVTVAFTTVGQGGGAIAQYACIGLTPTFSNSQTVTTSPYTVIAAGKFTVWTAQNGGDGTNHLGVSGGITDTLDAALTTACGRGTSAINAGSTIFGVSAGSFS